MKKIDYVFFFAIIFNYYIMALNKNSFLVLKKYKS